MKKYVLIVVIVLVVSALLVYVPFPTFRKEIVTGTFTNNYNDQTGECYINFDIVKLQSIVKNEEPYYEGMIYIYNRDFKYEVRLDWAGVHRHPDEYGGGM